MMEDKMFKTIRTDKLMNILIGVLSLLTIAIWYVTRQDPEFRPYTIYGLMVSGVYWSTFWWLQLMEHNRLSKDKEHQAKKKAKKELMKEMQKNKKPLREELQSFSKSKLIKDVLKSRRNFSIYIIVIKLYIGTVLYAIHEYLSLGYVWTDWVCFSILGFLIVVSFVNTLYYMNELRHLKLDAERELEQNIIMGLRSSTMINRAIDNLRLSREEIEVEVETSLDLSQIEREDEE